MPYNPLDKAQEIFSDLKNRSYENEATTNEIHKAIMRATNIMKSATLARAMGAFQKLGYLSEKSPGIWGITYWSEVAE